MIINLAENFTGFKIPEGTDEKDQSMAVSYPKDKFSKYIPAEFCVPVSPNIYSCYLYYGKQYVEGAAPFDKNNPDDKWIGISQDYSNGYTYSNGFKFPFTRNIGSSAKQCFSFSMAINEATPSSWYSRLGDLFSVVSLPENSDSSSNGWNNSRAFFSMDKDFNFFVGSGTNRKDVSKILANREAFTNKASFEIVLRPSSDAKKISYEVYLNDIMLGDGDVDAVEGNCIAIIFYFRSGSSAKGSLLNNCPLLIRDVVMSTAENDKEQIRMGSGFYVNKLLPLSDDENQWIGEGSHAEKMASKRPADGSGGVLSGYKAGLRESYHMTPLTGNRGEKVVAAFASIGVANTGSIPVDIDVQYSSVDVGDVQLAIGESAEKNINMPRNPLLERDWKISDFSSFSAGFGIKE